MATTKTPKQPIDLKQYGALADTIQSKLNSSPTAYTQTVAPTRTDLSNQLQLQSLRQQISQANDARLKQQLYGNEQNKSTNLEHLEPARSSFLTRGLDALATPLYGIVGAVEAATGKGTKPGLANIVSNIHEKETFGNYLQKIGITNKWVSMPLGFALDVALDPVNWATAGTDALIPKLATGLKEGGVEGLTTAAKAGGLQKANFLSKFVPFLKSGTREGLAAKAGAAEDAFREIAGMPSVIEKAAQTSQRTKLFDKAMDYATNDEGSYKQKVAQWLNKYGKYSPSEWFKASKKADEAIANEFEEGSRGTLDDLLHQFEGYAEFNTTPLNSEIRNMSKGQAALDLKNTLSDAALNPVSRGVSAGKNSMDVQGELQETAAFLNRASDIISDEIRSNRTETTVKWYDDLTKKINSNPYAKKVWDAFSVANGIFKVAKVPLNFGTAYTNAVASNLVMAGMGGINFTDPRYLGALKEGFKVARGKALGDIAPKIGDEVLQWLRKYKTTASEGLNLDASMLEKSLNERMVKQMAQEAYDAFSDATRSVYGKNSSALAEKQAGIISKFRNMFAGTKDINESSPFIRDEVFFGKFGEIMRNWEKNPEGTRKSIVNFLKKASEAYQTIDQTYKIGTFLHLSANGISGEELNRIARFVKFAPQDVEKFGNYYRFTPEKAAEVANELFMNYAAMPSAIKVLRSIPILGSPFASFSYAMMAKTAKTAVQNPSFFNKVTFARNEINSGERQSPLEKAALGGPYYSYLNRYERMKLPFFQDYPVYLNISNWVPYLGMNIFQEGERKYTNPLAENVGTLVDQLPFLKTAEGQLLFDYIIQPFVLNEAKPTGMFGQPLYYEGDSALQKVGRVAEGLGEAYTPSLLPPFGYRYRQLSNAMEGKTAAGTESKDPRSALFLRGLLGTLGVPVSGIDLENTTADIKKQLTPPKGSKKK